MESTQLKQVMDHLQNNGTITSWDAITTYHITRLSHFIWLLRTKEFLKITDHWEKRDGKRWKVYKLEGQAQRTFL